MKKEKIIDINFNLKTKLDFKIDQIVWFYLPNSLEVLKGKVIGFFALIDDSLKEGKKNYTYQIEYYKEQKDGTNKMFIGNAIAEDMNIDKKIIKKQFENIRKKRLEETIRQHKIELTGAKANEKFHNEMAKEIVGEIERLKKLRR